MDFGWLSGGALDVIIAVAQWLRQQPPLALIALAIAALVLVQIVRALMRRRRRRQSGHRAADTQPHDTSEGLKQQLRLKLAEPSALLAGPAAGAPTMGACRAFEGDIEAAARTVLVEAGGRRAKAKQLLRSMVEGNGAANGKLNGSEVDYWRQLGALSLVDSTREALAAYSRAADLAPDDPEGQMLLGVLSLRAGKLDAAEAAFRRQMRLGSGARGAAARYRGATMLGDVHAAREAFDDALADYQGAQREVLALLERDADNAGLQRDLSMTCDRIGDVLLAKGDAEGALTSFRHSLEIAEALAGRDPDNLGWQRDVSVSHDRIGDILEKMGDLDSALDSYRQGLAIAERLATHDPKQIEWQWDLSVSHDRIGDVLTAQGKAEEALGSYRRGLAVAAAAVVRDPANVLWQRDLAASYHKVGSIEAGRLNAGEARDYLEKGRIIIARLERIASHQAQWRSDLSRFDETLRTLGP